MNLGIYFAPGIIKSECRALDQVLEKPNQKKDRTHPVPRRFLWEPREREHRQKDAVGPTVKLMTSFSAAPAWPPEPSLWARGVGGVSAGSWDDPPEQPLCSHH